jgi:hypothetical protein
MIHGQAAKWFQALAPVSLNGAGTTIVIDTLGFDFLEVAVLHGAVGAADYTVLKASESDATSDANTLSSGSDITGLIVGTSTNIAGSASTFPGDTADGTIDLFEIDLRNRKRYIDISATSGAASLVAIVARLSRAEQEPTTATTKGARQVLRA